MTKQSTRDKFERTSGVLLHPTSLPSKHGIGDLGEAAYGFVNVLAETKQKLWQVLPLGPTGFGDSPYQCFSTFAGNPLLISLEKLSEAGLIPAQELNSTEHFDDSKVDYGRVINYKYALYRKAFANFVEDKEFKTFCASKKAWLNDYALFMSLKQHFNGHSWNEWENDIKLKEPAAITKYTKLLANEIAFHKFLQFHFFKQWYELKTYANKNGVKIIGDIPIYVAFDSSDAWGTPSAFFFDKNMSPTKVAGVPPDYFSKTGQLWGNPLYNWKALKKDNYKWWLDRIVATKELVDIIRIDHFRGFCEYWAVPYGSTTAIDGKWEKGPGADIFTAIKEMLGNLPILAEDLGLLTPDVHVLRDKFGFPSMKILEFAFNAHESSSYIPHLLEQNSVVYTGTHDNDTVVGWFKKASREDRALFMEYTNTDGKNVAWDFIRLAFASVADIAIVPMQDILSLDSDSRMNTPSLASGNWQWRFRWDQLTLDIKSRLKRFTQIYQR